MNTALVCSAAPSVSFAQDMRRTWFRSGCRRSRGCGRSWNGALRWRMWAAATARRAFSWPRRSPTRVSPASIIMASSVERGSSRRRAKPGSNRSCRFEVADAKSYPGNDYDLVAFFDCLTRHGRSGRRG